jgi:hypothetical protein
MCGVAHTAALWIMISLAQLQSSTAPGVSCHLLQGVKLALAKLQAPISKISFHPADNSILLTMSAQGAGSGESATCSSVGSGAGRAQAEQAGSSSAVLLWQLHKLWEKHELQCMPLQLPSQCQPACHAWAPEVRSCCHAMAGLLCSWLTECRCIKCMPIMHKANHIITNEQLSTQSCGCYSS